MIQQNIKGIHCAACKVVLYMQPGRKGSVPPVAYPDIQYCPVCGQKAEPYDKLDDGFWQEMAYYYGLPLDTMKMLYRTSDWNTTHRTFDSYIKALFQTALGQK